MNSYLQSFLNEFSVFTAPDLYGNCIKTPFGLPQAVQEERAKNNPITRTERKMYTNTVGIALQIMHEDSGCWMDGLKKKRTVNKTPVSNFREEDY